MIERYTRPEMGRIWSEENRFRMWMEVEVAACQAQAQLGRIPAKAAQNIRKKADFSVERVNELERVTDHDLIAFVTCMGEHIGPDGRYVHLGLTSTDVVDTAQALQLRHSADQLIQGLRALRRLRVHR